MLPPPRGPALPRGLEPIHIEKAVGWVEEQTSDLVDLYYEQANVFSGALESKGSIRSWAVQSHYDHPGWYIIWRYTVDPTRVLKTGREVVIWRVDVVFIRKEDWKYEGSTAGSAGGGRTHTFGLRRPAELLRDAAAYRAPGIGLRRGRPILISS